MTRPRRTAAALLAVVLAVSLPVTGGSLIDSGGADAVGRGLNSPGAGPVMQPVAAPARVARVAVVPGSPEAEAWGIGMSNDLRFGGIAEFGQVVLLRYTRGTGWRVDGPPLDAEGRPTTTALSSLSMADNGEGWAVGDFGQTFHRPPGGAWRLAVDSAVTDVPLYSVSIKRDSAGVYGYAVGADLTILRLEGGRWVVDSGARGIAPAGAVPELVSVATVSRDAAWAVTNYTSDRLLIFERSNGVWSRRTTGRAIFDAPPAPVGGEGPGTVVRYARGSAIAALGNTTWVTGEMELAEPLAPPGGDLTRPFAIRLGLGDDVTAFCPRIYRLSSRGVTTTVPVCDEPFPFATGNLPALAVVPGAVFAGGWGLFRFDGSRWRREPNTVGHVASGAFHSATEGWVATSGDNTVGGGLVVASSTALGHWTSSPEPARVRRWPQPAVEPLESVAVAPGGLGAVAVGRSGTILRLSGDTGWERERSPTREHLHAVAWSSPEEAWAVGGGAAVVRRGRAGWRTDPASGRLGVLPLYAVAFASPDRGVAVGAAGVILRYDGLSWTRDLASGRLTKADLNAVVPAGTGFIAAGSGGTVLELGPAGWRRVRDLDGRLPYGGSGKVVSFLSATSLADGTVYLGGSRGVIVRRRSGDPFRMHELPPLEGSVTAIAVRPDPGGRDTVLAAVGTQESRYAGDNLSNAVGWLFAGGPDGWRDLSLGISRGITAASDAPALRDPVHGVAFDPAGRAWAAGGYPPDTLTGLGHLRADGSSSVWRVALEGLPERSPSEAEAGIVVPRGGISFAFVGDTACASGLCSAAIGAGPRSDVVMKGALESIVRATRDGVRFVVHGGDLRRNGFPDELEPVRDALGALPVPAFGVLGDRDLFSGIGPSLSDEQSGLAPSNGYALDVFAGAPGPWGSTTAPPGFRAIAENTSGRAATHYAFDVMGASAPALRVIALDTSRIPLAGSAADQNPLEDQVAWLARVLREAEDRGIPTVVTMHQPLVLPASTAADAAAVTVALTANGADLVLAAHERRNRMLTAPAAGVPGAVPVGIFGSGGSPLQADWQPVRGAYHAWQLVTVRRPGSPGVAGTGDGVEVRSIPVAESIALDARDGRGATAGGALRFEALLRLPDVGGASSDGSSWQAAEGRATYIRAPFPARCSAGSPEGPGCTPADVAEPYVRFVSETPEVAAFVREDPAAPGKPFLDAGGGLVADARGGFLCTLRAGTAVVRVESGYLAARVPVKVTAGSGPCADARSPGDGPIERGAPEARVLDRRAEEDAPGYAARKPPESATAITAVPPPLVNPAPAPRAGGAMRREERELAPDSAQSDPDASVAEMRAHERPERSRSWAMTARHRREEWSMTQAWLALGALSMLAFVGATVAARRVRGAPARAYSSRR